MCGSQLVVCLVSLFVSLCRSCVSSSSVSRPPIPRWCPVRAWLFFTFLPTYLPHSFCQDSQVSVRTLKFACQDSQVYVRTAPSGRFRRGRARSKGGLGVYHSLLGGRGRRVAVKEGGSLFGGTCEHCEDRAPSGPRQDSVRTLSGLCQDSVRTVRTGAGGPQTRLKLSFWH